MTHPDSPEYLAGKATGHHYEPPVQPPEPDPDPAFDLWWSMGIQPRLEHAREMVVQMLASLELDSEFLRDARAKARAGWIEHGGGIVDMSPTEVHEEIMGEVRDLLVYGAAFQNKTR